MQRSRVSSEVVKTLMPPPCLTLSSKRWFRRARSHDPCEPYPLAPTIEGNIGREPKLARFPKMVVLTGSPSRFGGAFLALIGQNLYWS